VYDAPVPLRVVFAEDNYLVREGTVALLHEADDVDVVGTAATYDELLTAVETATPDAVLTDIRMPPTGTDEGIQAAARLRQDHPSIGVVVLSQYANPSYAVALLSDGSAGRAYLLKERVSDVEELLAAIRQVAAGGSVIDPKVVEALVSANSRAAPSDLDRLTKREGEILAEMAQGKSNAAIAAALILSERAVEKHTNSIFSKLGLSEERDVNRRVKAVLLYLAQPVRGG
jgi:DNA-binding NarL/FixJ family response regulator